MLKLFKIFVCLILPQLLAMVQSVKPPAIFTGKEGQGFTCTACNNKLMPTMGSLCEHLFRFHHEHMEYICCPFCQAEFKNINNVVLHMHTDYKKYERLQAVNVPEMEGGPVNCPVCKIDIKRVNFKTDFLIHILTEHVRELNMMEAPKRSSMFGKLSYLLDSDTTPGSAGRQDQPKWKNILSKLQEIELEDLKAVGREAEASIRQPLNSSGGGVSGGESVPEKSNSVNPIRNVSNPLPIISTKQSVPEKSNSVNPIRNVSNPPPITSTKQVIDTCNSVGSSSGTKVPSQMEFSDSGGSSQLKKRPSLVQDLETERKSPAKNKGIKGKTSKKPKKKDFDSSSDDEEIFLNVPIPMEGFELRRSQRPRKKNPNYAFDYSTEDELGSDH